MTPSDHFIMHGPRDLRSITSESIPVIVEGECEECGSPFFAPDCTLDTSTNPHTITGRVYCRLCEEMYVFYAEGDSQ